VLRHGGQRHVELARQLTDGAITGLQHGEYCAACRVRQRAECGVETLSLAVNHAVYYSRRWVALSSRVGQAFTDANA
jgi:hypothetical protein